MSFTGDKLHSFDWRICKPKSGKLTSEKAVHEKLSLCQRKQSARFSSPVVLPPDYVKVRQAIEGMKQWGAAQ